MAADDVTTWINSRLVSPHNNIQFETCLHFACLNGNVKIMRLLLAKGADVTALDFESCTPLHRACASHVDADAKVECLLRRGAASQVNARDDLGQTALHKAARRGRTQSVKLLLQHGALVDVKCNHGATALHCACASGDVACLHELVKHGADLEVRLNRWELTPLQLAAQWVHVDCMRVLLNYGADINATALRNRTALTQAVIWSDVKVIATLLAYAHCDVTIKDAFGRRAIDVARSREVKTLLMLGRNFESSRQA